MQIIPTLKTERLILRPWRASDLEAFAVINADKKVMEFIPKSLTRQESDALVKAFEEEWKQRHYGRWAIEVPNVADFIGYVGFHYYDFPAKFTPCVEIGWRLSADHWGKGYATEAAKAALDYGFHQLNMKENYAFTFQGNENSRKLMERLGMTYEPELQFEHPDLPSGHPMGIYVVYRIRPKV